MHHLVRPSSLKAVDVIVFLRELKAKFSEKMTLLLDNATIHKAKVVRDFCQENDIN